jgi:hypothetical protein
MDNNKLKNRLAADAAEATEGIGFTQDPDEGIDVDRLNDSIMEVLRARTLAARNPAPLTDDDTQ